MAAEQSSVQTGSSINASAGVDPSESAATVDVTLEEEWLSFAPLSPVQVEDQQTLIFELVQCKHRL